MGTEHWVEVPFQRQQIGRFGQIVGFAQIEGSEQTVGFEQTEGFDQMDWLAGQGTDPEGTEDSGQMGWVVGLAEPSSVGTAVAVVVDTGLVVAEQMLGTLFPAGTASQLSSSVGGLVVAELVAVVGMLVVALWMGTSALTDHWDLAVVVEVRCVQRDQKAAELVELVLHQRGKYPQRCFVVAFVAVAVVAGINFERFVELVVVVPMTVELVPAEQ